MDLLAKELVYKPDTEFHLNNISFGMKKGEIYTILGRTLSGKTTLLKAIAGLVNPQSGRILFDGADLSRVPVWKRNIAMVYQQFINYPHLNVFDNVAFPLRQRGVSDKELKSRVYDAIERVGLKDFESRKIQALSGGQQQRVALARSLAKQAKILLLDEPTNNLDINSIRWLEEVLSARKSTMVIISHDRHFLNGVCTHMADLDYGALNVFPGSYDDFMIAATAIQERMRADNAKKEEKIKDLKHFVSRFSANASKSKQATSRLKQLNKIELDDIKPSSRVSPYIIFNQSKELFRNVLEVQGLSKGYDGEQVLKDINLMIETGERVAIIGQNGIGKSTLLKTLFGEVEADSGNKKWSENSNIGCYAQDHNEEFDKDMSVLDWMTQFKNEKDDVQVMRSVLGKMLFGKEDVKKSVKSLSGGEKGRMIFGRLMLQKPNILLMDEPTNHLDMESIEALNLALDNYKGTLIFVSHDREFVSSLSTKVVELKDDGAHYYSGNYEDYLLSQV